MEDYYFWKAEYFDGTVISQYKTDGTATKWDELDFTKIKYWVLEPINSSYKRFIITLEGKKRPIFWRTTIGMAVGGNLKIICYKFGWQDTIDGKNIKVLNFIYPNGDVEQLIDRDDPLLINSFMDALKMSMVKTNENK